MLKISLPNTARVTTRLGFGGAELFGGRSKSHSFALLDAAVESGIMHFDVAPSYALGLAEEVLGEYLHATGVDASVTTKYGIPPRTHGKILSDVRILAKKLTSRIPSAQKFFKTALKSSAPKPSFSDSQMRDSLTASLKKLRKDRIDLFILHEPSVELLDQHLILEIEAAISAGTIGAAGVGGDYGRIKQVADYWPGCFHVIQHQWLPPAEADQVHNDRFRILFGTVSKGLPRLNNVLSDKKIKEQISKTVDIDLCDQKEVARVAVAMGLIENPNGIVLFSSKNTDRVRAIGSVLNDEKLLSGVSKLARLISK